MWGETSREEAVATVREAYDAGITLFDMAPLYGNGEAERVMGLAFPGMAIPADVRLTTKCMVGAIAPEEIEARLVNSLTESCERLARDYVDVFVLHGYVIPDGWQVTISTQSAAPYRGGILDLPGRRHSRVRFADRLEGE